MNNRNSGLFYRIVACFLLWPFLLSCTSKDHNQATKFEQYFVQGKGLYEVHCSNCHQKNGTGLGLLYPPINKSDFIDTRFEKVVCLIKNGIEGELVVNGKGYNKPMKGITILTELEIAEITTYIYNSWGRKRAIVEVKEVNSALGECSK